MIDALFSVHPDFKSHTGAVMMIKGRKGAVICNSVKQKLITTSSMTAELVAVDQMMSMVIWTKLFLQEQGYDIGNDNVIYQGNKSAILLEKIGRRVQINKLGL